jgi:hypothetical protein
MRVYYAHCMAIYGSEQEEKDIQTLEALGFEVLNPSGKQHCNIADEIRKTSGSSEVMEYFYDRVRSCDALAFRALSDGSIPAGVGGELKVAREQKMPVIELPEKDRTVLSINETRRIIRASRYGN